MLHSANHSRSRPRLLLEGYLEAARASALRESQRLVQAVEAILAGYAVGTRYHIGASSDGLLAAGEPCVQLTWMDAKLGKVQALWLNGLWIGAQLETPSAGRWRELLARGLGGFEARFWDSERQRLFVEAWLRVRGGTNAAKEEARTVGGCPFQAWSLGELMRLNAMTGETD